jgi:aldehyde dehydrogenase (NAD+)
MREGLRLYIDGEWVEPMESRVIEVINPATEEAFGRVSLGSTADVDRAVTAAKAAFATYSQTSKANRIALLEKVIACYQERLDCIAETISLEMGAPMSLATAAQAPKGLTQHNTAREVLKDYEFQQTRGTTLISASAGSSRRGTGP